MVCSVRIEYAEEEDLLEDGEDQALFVDINSLQFRFAPAALIMNEAVIMNTFVDKKEKYIMESRSTVSVLTPPKISQPVSPLILFLLNRRLQVGRKDLHLLRQGTVSVIPSVLRSI